MKVVSFKKFGVFLFSVGLSGFVVHQSFGNTRDPEVVVSPSPAVRMTTKPTEIPNLLVNLTEFEEEPLNASTGFIVPNIVHMLHFDAKDLTFFEVVSLKAAQLHQKPEKIYIHCNLKGIQGKYWNMVKDIPELELKYKAKPTYIFGKKLNSVYHASDIARMEVMMEYGGIYIDTDTYIVNSLDQFRKYEFSIGWPKGMNLGTQILVGHKNARFLRLWYNSYKYYKPKLWYYNAGQLPTKNILEKMPCLVHRVPRDFGVDYNIKDMMYTKNTDAWKTYKTIHYLIRHIPKASPLKKFDENNIKKYNRTFGAMARLVLYGTTDLIS